MEQRWKSILGGSEKLPNSNQFTSTKIYWISKCCQVICGMQASVSLKRQCRLTRDTWLASGKQTDLGGKRKKTASAQTLGLNGDETPRPEVSDCLHFNELMKINRSNCKHQTLYRYSDKISLSVTSVQPCLWDVYQDIFFFILSQFVLTLW